MADQIGYRPNRAGVRLRTGKTNVISLVLSVETEVLGLTPCGSGSVQPSLRHALSPGRHALSARRRSDDAGALHLRDGIGRWDRPVSDRPEDPRVRYLLERRMPFATHGRTELRIAHPFFDFDNERYAEIAVARLARRGRRRLALIGPDPRYTYARHMTRGFLTGLEGMASTRWRCMGSPATPRPRSSRRPSPN